jgi:hypothetical protein
LRFGTGFVGATGFAFVFDTGFVGTTRFVFPFGAAFLGTGRFVFTARFTARFAGATDFVFRFDFAPLAGFARATGLPFVFVAFVARVFGRGAGTYFRCAGTGYHTSVARASIAALSSSIVISPST